jgi:hypothetical protein
VTMTAHRTTCGRGPLVATIAIMALTLPFVALAQSVDVVYDNGTFEVRYTATLPADDLVFGRALGYDTVSFPNADCLGEIGKPMLPVKILRIALPAGMNATQVRAEVLATTELPGEYDIMPAQPPRRISDPKSDELVAPDRATYASSTAYPVQTPTLLAQTDLAGQAMAVIRICPVQYVPASRKLILATATRIVLDGVTGYTCGDYLPRNLPDAARQDYAREVASMVVNPDDVELQSAHGQPAGRGVAPGRYDYVIITRNSWVSAFQPLADWRTKKGIPSTIVTTTWIYSNYSGSTNQEKIRAFIVDAHDTWGAYFFLLGGDTDYIPCDSRLFETIDATPVANDTYYADYDDDWSCELRVGRASVTTTGTSPGGIGNFVNKILTYEKNPPLTDYAKKAAFFGFDLDSGTPAEQCKEAISNLYIPSNWTVTKVYDSQSGNHLADVIAAVNAGQNLLNHCDHCSSDYMGMGYVNHGTGIGTGDVDAFHNGNRQGTLYSMGCWPAAFDSANCIAEHFVRDTNGGGVAFIGNSRYGWYNPGYYASLSMRYDQAFFQYLLFYHKLGLGFNGHKGSFYPGDDLYKYIFTELTLLGDPELPIWTQDPLSLTVTHSATLYVAQHSTFPVHVIRGGRPLSGATVCLWKPGDVYVVAQTDSSGTATFDFTPGSVGSMYVTASFDNCLPNEGTAQVVPPATGDLNCDGAVNGFDIDAFVLALTAAPPDYTAYYTQYPGCNAMNGDINCDGAVNGFDIDAFVLCLTSGCSPCP